MNRLLASATMDSPPKPRRDIVPVGVFISGAMTEDHVQHIEERLARVEDNTAAIRADISAIAATLEHSMKAQEETNQQVHKWLRDLQSALTGADGNNGVITKVRMLEESRDRIKKTIWLLVTVFGSAVTTVAGWIASHLTHTK